MTSLDRRASLLIATLHKRVCDDLCRQHGIDPRAVRWVGEGDKVRGIRDMDIVLGHRWYEMRDAHIIAERIESGALRAFELGGEHGPV